MIFHQAVVILGSPNDDKGNLSSIAVGRAETALEIYSDAIRCSLILTGGVGPNFNCAPLPHAKYLKNYLVARGVDPADIIACLESKNTVEDALFVKEFLTNTGEEPEILSIVTSDFHMERARFIFNTVLGSRIRMEFVAASHGLQHDDLLPFIAHEQEALRDLRSRGVVIPSKNEHIR